MLNIGRSNVFGEFVLIVQESVSTLLHCGVAYNLNKYDKTIANIIVLEIKSGRLGSRVKDLAAF